MSAAFIFVWLAAPAAAAVLSFGEPRPAGGAVVYSLDIDTEGETINVLEPHLTYDPVEVSIRDISVGGSPVSIWIAKPRFSNLDGSLEAVGGIIGRLRSRQGRLMQIVFVAQKPTVETRVRIGNSRVLLHDGKGTDVSALNDSMPLRFLHSAAGNQ